MSEQTPEQAARSQVAGVAADLGAGPQTPPDVLGAQMQASGAAPGEVDASALLAHIRAMQARLDSLEAEKRQELAPEVVKYADALAAHIAAKAAASPGLAAHPDHPLTAGADLVAKVADAARAEADGKAGALAGPLADLTAWVKRSQQVFHHLDWHYVLQLAEEAAAAARLAA